MFDKIPSPPKDVMAERQQLTRASRLHWIHWVVVSFSLLLTITAWYFSQKQLREKVELQFLREAEQVVALVTERMQKYEDGLWGGVSAIQTHGGDINYSDWKIFAHSLRIEEKYPGINGIGVIHHVPNAYLNKYLTWQHLERPAYRIYPPHDEPENWPISYIEPVDINARAVGLDMAHETNRYQAAKKARDTGKAQITGPIILVQDSKKSPGFLFFAPFYKGGRYETLEERQQHIRGLVYAPFVVSNLMQGTLERQNRHVVIQISDGDDVLFDEHSENEADFDPNPMFSKTYSVDLYGRTWEFHINSSDEFKAMNASSQPFVILFGGLFIDGLLLALFIFISRSNRHAIAFADRMNRELQTKTKVLQETNKELEKFAYVASHDLQEPLRKILMFGDRLNAMYLEELDQKGQDYLNRIMASSKRLKMLIQDLLTLSRVNKSRDKFMPVDLTEIAQEVVFDLDSRIVETSGRVEVEPLASIPADPVQIHQLLQNLIGNALKFHREDVAPVVKVYGSYKTLEVSNGTGNRQVYELCVEDNGIGFAANLAERIFEPFERLHGRSNYEGTGMGTTICKKIVQRHGGTIKAQGVPNQGACFTVMLPVNTS